MIMTVVVVVLATHSGKWALMVKTYRGNLEINNTETHSRIQFIRPQKKLYFRRTLSRCSQNEISMVQTKIVKSR